MPWKRCAPPAAPAGTGDWLEVVRLPWKRSATDTEGVACRQINQILWQKAEN